MNRNIFLLPAILLLLAAPPGFAQPVVKLWDKTLGGVGNESTYGNMTLNVNRDGNLLVCGSSESDSGYDKTQNSYGNTDIWAIAIDSVGDIIWDKAFGGVNNDGIIGSCYYNTEKNQLLISDITHNGVSGNITAPIPPGGNNADAVIIEVDSLGFISKQKRFSGGGLDYVTDLLVKNDKVYVTGLTSGFISGDLTDTVCGTGDILFAAYNNLGQWLFNHTHGGLGYEFAIKILSYGHGFLIGGQTTSPVSCNQSVSTYSAGNNDLFLLNIDTLGNILSQFHYGGSGSDRLLSMFVLPNKRIILSAFSNSPVSNDVSQSLCNPNGNSLWILMIDSLGNKIWDKRYSGFNRHSDIITLSKRIISTTDGGFLLSLDVSDTVPFCDVTEQGRGNLDYWIIKVDSLGNKVWDKRFGGSGNDISPDLVELKPGVYAIAGKSDSPISGDKTHSYKGAVPNFDYWIVCFADTTIATGIEYPKQTTVPSLYIYPNPATNSCTITCSFTNASLTLYDITGRILLQQPFNTKATIDVSKLSRGVYIAEVKDKNGVSVKGKVVKE